MLEIGKSFAKQCEDILEGWLEAGEVTEERLFSFLYYPVPDTSPPKFITDYTRLADRDVRPASDEVLEANGAIVFAVLVDVNGYLPAHNQKYSLPLTGNLAADLIGNRTRRIFADRTGLAAARNEAPHLIQRYERDTGELMEDLSIPVMVKGRKWGAIRIGYRVVRE